MNDGLSLDPVEGLPQVKMRSVRLEHQSRDAVGILSTQRLERKNKCDGELRLWTRSAFVDIFHIRQAIEFREYLIVA